MENKKMGRLKYVTPTSRIMEFDPGCILAGSSGPGGWRVDGVGGSGGTGASSGGWSIDGGGGGGGTGASSGGWSIDDGGGSSGTGASTGGWSTD